MSTSVALLLVLSAGTAVALLVYVVTRSNYSARVATVEALAAQLTVQIAERGRQLDTLRQQLAAEQESRARAEATLEAERKALVDQKRMLDEAEQKLSAVF